MKKNTFSTLLLAVVFVALGIACPAFAMTRHSQKVKQPSSSKSGNNAEQTVQQIAGSVPAQMRGVLIDGLPNALGKMVSADDHVDVLLTFDAVMRNGNKEKVAVTLLQNVKVLAAGVDSVYSMSRPSDKSGYVVLALSPRDAQYLALSWAEGTVDVIVRTSGDTNTYLMEVSTFDKLFQ